MTIANPSKVSKFGYFMQVAGLGAAVILSLPSPYYLSRGLPILLLGILLQSAARAQLGLRSYHLEADPTTGILVRTGPYRWIRHPIHLSNCLIALAVVLIHGSALSYVAFSICLTGAVIRVCCEEQCLALRYPEFKEYQSVSWRMLPFVF